jgi:hypothetical protein
VRAEWEPPQIKLFLDAVAVASRDGEWIARKAKRARAIDDTIDKLKAGKHFTGLPTLAKCFDNGVVDEVASWLRLGRHDEEHERLPGKMIKTSGEFVAGFTPPDYLIDNLLQRQFIYSLTGQTGNGKTAIALLLAYCIATGTAIGQRETQPGRVIYFAGENPDDVRQRWIAMAEHLKFDVDAIDVHFVVGVISLKELESAIRQEITDTGPVTAIIVDTSAAYFLGEDENSNRQWAPMPGSSDASPPCQAARRFSSTATR